MSKEALTRMRRKLEIMQLDAKTPTLSADVYELLRLLDIIERGMRKE